MRLFSTSLNAGRQLPNLGAFVLPGTTFDSVASAPAGGRGRKLGKATGGKKGDVLFDKSVIWWLQLTDVSS